MSGHEFTEDVADGSMCVCGVPALSHDHVYPAAVPVADGLREAVDVLLDAWADIPPVRTTNYDWGRVDQREMCAAELAAVLLAVPEPVVQLDAVPAVAEDEAFVAAIERHDAELNQHATLPPLLHRDIDYSAPAPLADPVPDGEALAEHEQFLRGLWREMAEKGIESGVDWPRIVLTLFADLDRAAAHDPALHTNG